MKKKIIIGSVVAVALIVAVLVAAPFYNVHRFFQAVENRDAGGVAEAVDMAEVRTQFQSQFQAELVHNPDQSFQQWAAFRKREAEATFELMVTPDGLLRMMPVAFAQRDRQWSFMSPSRVAVTVEAASAESLATKLTFQRQGLLTWRLTRVERIRRDGSPDFSLAPGEEAGNTTVLSLDDLTPGELAEFHARTSEDERVDTLEDLADRYDEMANMTTEELLRGQSIDRPAVNVFTGHEQALVNQAQMAWEAWRGSGEDSDYDRHSALLAQLFGRGICWGRVQDAQVEYEYHRCRDDSVQMQ